MTSLQPFLNLDVDPQHHPYLLRCLDLARIPGAEVEPNPRVGAVVVYRGKIVGEGWHERFGGPHAEVNAIRSVADPHILPESTLYISLEPCNHHGKTPPCTELILQHKIPRVVVGALDPNPKMAGKSLEFLKSKGVEVILNDEPAPFEFLNTHFEVNQRLGRPFITLKWAQSADCFIAALSGDGNLRQMGEQRPVRTQISSEQSSRWVHRLRHEHHAILIGANTALFDQPRLDTRLYPGRSPVPIVLDEENRVGQDISCFAGKKRGIWVQTELSESDGPIVRMRSGKTFLDLMTRLYAEQRIGSILVEGGRQVLQQFLDAGLVDDLWVVTSGKCLGNGLPAPVLPAHWKVQKEFLSQGDRIQQFHNPAPAIS